MPKTEIRIWLSRMGILLVLSSLGLTLSCNSSRASAEKALEQHLKGPGIRALQVDFFHTDPNFPGKAYISATVTHNFASSDGNFKKEYLGYILVRDGDGWKIEKGTGYTKEEAEASTLLSGEKIRRHGSS